MSIKWHLYQQHVHIVEICDIEDIDIEHVHTPESLRIKCKKKIHNFAIMPKHYWHFADLNS